jgi:multicomponent Na+:H+ antiporter subunit F
MNILALTAGGTLILSLILLIRLKLGPTVADRMVAVDTISNLLLIFLVVVAFRYQETIFLDLALATALLSWIGTLVLARYLEGKL